MKVVLGLVQQYNHTIEDPSSFCACSLKSYSCWVLSLGFSPLDCNVAAIAPDITSSEVNKKGIFKEGFLESHENFMFQNRTERQEKGLVNKNDLCDFCPGSSLLLC